MNSVNGVTPSLSFAKTASVVPSHQSAMQADQFVEGAVKEDKGPSLGARIGTLAMGTMTLAGGAGLLGAAAPAAQAAPQQTHFFVNPGLGMVPSVAPAVLHSVNSEQAPTSGTFIKADLRTTTEQTASASTSMSDVTAKFTGTDFATRGGGKPFEKGREKGSEKGSEKGREKGEEKGREKGEEKGSEKGREKGEEKGREKGQEKGTEKGREKGEEKGREKGQEKGTEKGHEKGEEKGHEKGQEKGTEKGHEKGTEKGHEKGTEKGTEKGHEKGNEKSRRAPLPNPVPTKPDPVHGNPDPVHGTPNPGKPEPGKPQPGKPEPGKPEPGKPEPGKPEPGRPTPGRPTPVRPQPPVVHPGPAPKPGRPSEPGKPPVTTINEGGHQYKVPKGGWVTNSQKQHPDLRSTVIDRNHDWRNQVVNVDHWHDHDWGNDWNHHPHGFFYGDSFWLGFDMGEMSAWDWADQPVYIMSPVTGDDCGQLAPPDGGFADQNSAYQSMLNQMAQPQQDPNDPNYDPTAGLYVGSDNFDPTNPGQQLSGDDAFSDLSGGQAVYFHPPNGDWEALSSLGDLNAYLYTGDQQAPPSTGDDGSGTVQTGDDGTATVPTGDDSGTVQTGDGSGSTASTVPLLDPTVTLQQGDGLGSDGPNASVTAAQQRLSKAGFPVDPDGQYGSGTAQAVMNFQTAQGLSADGVIGHDTATALNQVNMN